MSLSAKLEGLEQALAAESLRAERAITSTMRDASDGMRDELRDQVVKAGLGNRLARTWRGKTYPQSGTSLEPAAFVWSKAPRIISAFATGAAVEPRFSNYLAIPTENVPRRAGGRGAKAKMSPRDVERQFGQSLTILRGKRGTILGFVNAVRARSKSRPGLRQPTSRRAAQGRKSELLLMFVFVPRVRLPKLLDLQAVADRWSARVPSMFEAKMGMT